MGFLFFLLLVGWFQSKLHLGNMKKKKKKTFANEKREYVDGTNFAQSKFVSCDGMHLCATEINKNE